MLFDGVKDFAIVSLDQQGRITEWNFGATQVFGYTSEEIVGEDVSVLFTPEDRSGGIPQAELRQAESEGVALEERWHLHKNGERVFASGAMRPIHGDAGQLFGFVTIVRDITARKRSEDALREAQAVLADEAAHLERLVADRTTELTATNTQLEAFVYSIAHDLRPPLRAMEGFSAMLVEEAGATLSETGRDYAGRINRSARYMDALLGDLLAFSRISQKRVELTAVNLEIVVEPVLARLQKEIAENNARMERAGPRPVVLAHEATLAQVLFNLVSNALKFVRQDVPPVVRLRTEDRAEFIRIWVEDNGIGIAADYHAQIFGLFTRLHGGTYPGTGIGLAIVQKGIERMGGRMGLESTPGQGSRFWFELKRA
jgi:PAS domain S-box-containing protein